MFDMEGGTQPESVKKVFSDKLSAWVLKGIPPGVLFGGGFRYFKALTKKAKIND